MDRMALYEQGLTDKEIASVTGSTVIAIQHWRRYHKFCPDKKTRKVKEKKNPPISFRKVLPQEAHDTILRFLYMVDHYKPKNMKGFLQLWNEGVVQ